MTDRQASQGDVEDSIKQLLAEIKKESAPPRLLAPQLRVALAKAGKPATTERQAEGRSATTPTGLRDHRTPLCRANDAV